MATLPRSFKRWLTQLEAEIVKAAFESAYPYYADERFVNARYVWGDEETGYEIYIAASRDGGTLTVRWPLSKFGIDA